MPILSGTQTIQNSDVIVIPDIQKYKNYVDLTNEVVDFFSKDPNNLVDLTPPAATAEEIFNEEASFNGEAEEGIKNKRVTY